VHRGISGGEKRRVMVAMELVKVPSVLFLDEPTSGLDAFNASVLVQCLRDLAQRRHVTVVMSIHQPRSNIFYSFNRLVLLSKGSTAYYGTVQDMPAFFDSIGRPIPPACNPADFLIDVLFSDEHQALSMDRLPYGDHDEMKVESLELGAGSKAGSGLPASLSELSEHLVNRSSGSLADKVEKGGHEIIEAFQASSFHGRMLDLVKEEGGDALSLGRRRSGQQRCCDGCVRVIKAPRKWLKEVAVLSKRALLDLIRNPALVFGHWLSAIYFAGKQIGLPLTPRIRLSEGLHAPRVTVLIGVAYYNVGLKDIAAVQNRLGAFTLSCAFLAFTSMSAIPVRPVNLICLFFQHWVLRALWQCRQLFWLERHLYVYEVSNGFYSSSAYFITKVRNRQFIGKGAACSYSLRCFLMPRCSTTSSPCELSRPCSSPSRSTA
jgi:energy-coupling factor transporter ATP-binding protein EcfA2